MKKDSTIKFVGLDVHSKTISVAIADEGREGEVRHYGTIKNTFEAIDKVIKNLTATGIELKFIYEAGPCGFALYRYLTGNGFTCIVTSPAMIPRRKNVRIKNDRRDAMMLARLYRAGELTGIYVPEPEDEAVRDLARSRDDARVAERKAKQRLNSFLLRNNLIYPGKTKWNRTYFNWLGSPTSSTQVRAMTSPTPEMLRNNSTRLLIRESSRRVLSSFFWTASNSSMLFRLSLSKSLTDCGTSSTRSSNWPKYLFPCNFRLS